MSITFYLEETPEKPAPRVKVYCKDLYPSLDDGDFACDPTLERDAQGYYETRSTWPEANFANANARIVLGLLGLPDEDFGVIEAAQVATVRQRLLAALNREAATRSAARPGQQQVGAHGACVVDCEANAESFKRRLAEVSAVLTAAQTEGVSVIWS